MPSDHDKKSGKYPRNPRDRKPAYDPSLEPKTGATGKRGEPISLAEELALELTRGSQKNEEDENLSDEDFSCWQELQQLSTKELIAEARALGENAGNTSDEIEDRGDLILRIIKQRLRQSGMMFAEGTLEILPDEFGFIRNPENYYLSGSDDIYISPSQVRRFSMRNGSTISGQIRPPKENERYFALLRVAAINHEDPNRQKSKPQFEEMTPTHSETRLPLDVMESRLVDLLAPIGFGQRGLIVGPPRSGKTRLLTEMARSLFTEETKIEGYFLSLAKPQEEVLELSRSLHGLHLEFAATRSDESSPRHVQLAEIILEKAKRSVEYGKDVVLFLDSISDFVYAWNSGNDEGERRAPLRIDPRTFERTKKYMYSAKCFEEGGSLTLIATLPISTGSPLDELIYNELHGTGQFEITLNEDLAKKGLFPAVDFTKTATKREELLRSYETYHHVMLLRKHLAGKTPEETLAFLQKELARFETNEAFLAEFEKSGKK